MKRVNYLASCFCLIAGCLVLPQSAYSQRACQFNIIGDWRIADAGTASSTRFRFREDGSVTRGTTSKPGGRGDLGDTVIATYWLDNPKAPKVLKLQVKNNSREFAPGEIILSITAFDDTSFTAQLPDNRSLHWSREEDSRYFIILAGRRGAFYDRSGPAFPMLLKKEPERLQVDALGIYSVGGKAAFGTIPAETYGDFFKESGNASDVMLRMEISRPQYDRGLLILRTWERRVREGTLLYPDITMDNILLVKQITESLNQCSDKVHLYNLDWGVDDKLSDTNKPAHIPFLYFQELRRLNQALHINDEKFQHHSPSLRKVMGH
jgi:hypothetical protein